MACQAWETPAKNIRTFLRELVGLEKIRSLKMDTFSAVDFYPILISMDLSWGAFLMAKADGLYASEALECLNAKDALFGNNSSVERFIDSAEPHLKSVASGFSSLLERTCEPLNESSNYHEKEVQFFNRLKNSEEFNDVWNKHFKVKDWIESTSKQFAEEKPDRACIVYGDAKPENITLSNDGIQTFDASTLTNSFALDGKSLAMPEIDLCRYSSELEWYLLKTLSQIDESSAEPFQFQKILKVGQKFESIVSEKFRFVFSRHTCNAVKLHAQLYYLRKELRASRGECNKICENYLNYLDWKVENGSEKIN